MYHRVLFLCVSGGYGIPGPGGIPDPYAAQGYGVPGYGAPAYGQPPNAYGGYY